MANAQSNHNNLYIELLAKFRRAYAAYGDSLFFLAVVTNEELETDPRLRQHLLCYIPLDDNGSGWNVLAGISAGSIRIRAGDAKTICKLFRKLASLAGASLPLTIRRRLPAIPGEPLSWWLSFLWLLNPPTEEDLAKPDGIRNKCRAIWTEPFLESIDAIEACKLHTDQPEFPPSPRRYREPAPDGNAAGPMPSRSAKAKAKRDQKLEARDKWIYEECCKVVPYKKIAKSLSHKAKEKGWNAISSVQGIRVAASRYAARHDLPPIPDRQPS